MSVTEEKLPVLVPPELLMATVRPPVVRLLPALSLAVSRRVTDWPAATVVGLPTILRVEVLSETGPGITMICGEAVVTDTPPMVAPMFVAVPARTPVKVAE